MCGVQGILPAAARMAHSLREKARPPRLSLIRSPPSEHDLYRKLHHARIPRLQHLPERGIRKVSIGILEFRVIPGVIEFRPEFRADSLGDRRDFRDHQVGVAERRTAAQRMGRVSKGPELLRARLSRCGIAEIRGIEPIITRVGLGV